MAYEVVNEFIDLDNEKHHYQVGDTYPVDGCEPTEKRIEELSTEHPKYKRVFIKKVDSEGPSDQLTASEIKKMNKGPQEELITKLGGNPDDAKNEEERIALILELQEKQPPE